MFYSILFPDNSSKCLSDSSACFKDLNLDRVFSQFSDRDGCEYLKAYFNCPPADMKTVCYRQDVFKDLESNAFRGAVKQFSENLWTLGLCMDSCRKELAVSDTYLYMGKLLYYAERYCKTIDNFTESLRDMPLSSEGMKLFMSFLREYAESPEYISLKASSAALREKFSSLQYCMLIRNGAVRVKKLETEENLTELVFKCFERFRQEDSKDYRHKFRDEPHANHVEEGILRCLSKIYPEEFSALQEFRSAFINFENDVILRFSREVRFYLVWLEYTDSIKKSGLSFCIPELSESSEHIYANNIYDIAMAKFMGNKTVPNDFYLDQPEKIIVITGPNQGGKTSFARAIAQIHYLASLGLTVPGTGAHLLLTDKILCHFEREEDIANLSGKLQEELLRLKELLKNAGHRSLLVINEIFASTTLNDALQLGRYMIDDIRASGAFAVIVTFMDELAVSGEDTVSMLSLVDPDNPQLRSYKIQRRPPDGLAYAVSMAKKYQLSYEQLMGRLRK